MAESFWNNLKRSNLLTRAQLESTREHLAGSPGSDADVVAWLVDQDWLTAWQGDMLLAGHSRFFLGRYRLMSLLGQGGMGAVFRAEQTPLGRAVAIKVLARNMIGDDEAVARFRREIEAAAALVHPNIVTAYDADCVQGSHFLVMDFVEGCDLSSLLKERGRLPVGEACEYVRQAALGLQHAFEQDMVHRDIKPGNLLVHHESGRPPVVKVLDMGLARFTSETSEAGHLTQAGQVMGTPDYIAPEQSMDAHTADIRADIFSLGCTLFRMLTGQLPWPDGSPVQKLIARRATDAPLIRSLRGDIPEELEATVARMLARDPTDRFQTPAELAQALGRFADASPEHGSASGEAVSTAPSSSGMTSTRILQPERSTVDLMQSFSSQSGFAGAPDAGAATQGQETFAATAAVTTASSSLREKLERQRHADRRRLWIGGATFLLLAVIVIGWLQWRAARQTHFVFRWSDDERGEVRLQVDGQERSAPAGGEPVFPSEPGRRTLRLERPEYFPVEISVALAAGESHTVHPDWKPTPPLLRKNRLRELQQQMGAADSSQLDELRGAVTQFRMRWPGTAEACDAAALFRKLPSFAEVFSADDTSEYELKIAGGGDQIPEQLVAVIGDSRLRHAGHIRDLVFTPDGTQLVSVGNDSHVKCWDVHSGELQRTLMQQEGIHRLAFSPDGTQLAIGALDLMFLDWPGGDVLQTVVTNRNARLLKYAPDGMSMMFADYNGFQRLDVATSELTRQPDHRDAAFSPDGARVVFVDHTHGHIIDRSTGEQLHEFAFPHCHSPRVRWSPDGEKIAVSGSHMKGVQLFHADSGEKGPTISWGENCRFEFHPDSNRVALFDASGGGMLADLGSKKVIRNLRNGVTCLAFSPNGDTLATGNVYGDIQFLDCDTGQLQGERMPPISSLAMSVDGRVLVTGHTDGSLRKVDLAGERKPARIESPAVNHRVRNLAIWSLDFAPDGMRLASGGADFAVRVHDLDDLATTKESLRHGSHHVACVRFSGDGQLVASSGNDETVRLWDPESDDEIATCPVELDHVMHLAIHPAGNLIGVSDRDGHTVVWDVERDKAWPDSPNYGFALDFSPDGRLLAFGDGKGNVGLKELASPENTRHVVRHPHVVRALAFSPDGRTLASASSDGLIRWATIEGTDAKRDLQAIQLGSGLGSIRRLIFTPDARHLITGNQNGTVCVLRLEER